jgi:hypothetical protein
LLLAYLKTNDYAIRIEGDRYSSCNDKKKIRAFIKFESLLEQGKNDEMTRISQTLRLPIALLIMTGVA